MGAYEEALAFLRDPARVRFYGNKRRAAEPCPACNARGEEPCIRYDGAARGEMHPERRTLKTPRTEKELDAIVEKLARKYANPRSQCTPWFREPRRYPR